ncbi:radical SAM protein [Patescibacteria group bacterium]|nr:radical SAM protein [Patescibacteria group bacterium]
MIKINKLRSLTLNYLQNKPYVCTWQATTRCNLKCGYCKYWRKENSEPVLSLEQINLISEKLNEIGSFIFIIGGGEPLIRNDLVEIIRSLSKYHSVHILTNGWFVTDNIARQIFEAGADTVGISIDSNIEEIHDKSRGVSGSFEKAVQAIKSFQQAKQNKWQKVYIMTMIGPHNEDHLEDIIRFARELGVGANMQPYSSAKTGVTISYSYKLSNHLLFLQKKYKNFLSSVQYIKKMDQYLNGGIDKCIAGKYLFNISSDGNVSKCVESNQYVGNILTTPLGKIIKQLNKEHQNNSCKNCWHNCRGEVESFTFVNGLARLWRIYRN